MKIAAVQFAGVPGSVHDNMEIIGTLARQGADEGCRLLLFPEISDLGYDFSSICAYGRSSWPEVSTNLSLMARDCGLTLVCGVCATQGPQLRNALVAWGPDGHMVARYDKTHLFSSPEANERSVFHPGKRIVVFDMEGIRFGLSICYDLRFPELFRAQALGGAHVMLVASAWPRRRIEIWKTLSMARALENQCFLLGANRVGATSAFTCGGCSLFASPSGDLTLAAPDQNALLTAEISLSALAEVRAAIPSLKDRRPELYANLPQPSRALTEE